MDSDFIERLSNARGTSGDEGEVTSLIREKISGFVDNIEVDTMGNLIALKGMEKNGPKVMLNAHMDEVGLIITRVDEKGFLYFKKVGGIDDRVIYGKKVIIGAHKVKGVIGAKAIHLQKKEEVERTVEAKELFIDIGAESSDEAKRLVTPGSYATFDTPFEKLNENYFVGKAFDDRLGCSIASELLEYNYDFPVIALFSSQEEIGLRGAATGTYKYTPDISITIEGTISADIPEVKEYQKCSIIGNGPVITIKDRSVITDEKLRKKLVSVATKNSIPYQFKQVIAGGTDSSRIQLTKDGVRVLVIAVPVRYIHSPVSLFYREDYDNTKKLIYEFLKCIKEDLHGSTD